MYFMKYRVYLIHNSYSDKNVIDYWKQVASPVDVEAENKNKAVRQVFEQYPIHSRPILYTVEML